MNLSDFYRQDYEPLKLFNTIQREKPLNKYAPFLDNQIKERTQYEKINDTYYFDVRGCEKETISCEIADGQLNVIATGKIGEREYDYNYSVRVGEASQYEINCEYKAGVLAVELKKKQSKRTIKIN